MFLGHISVFRSIRAIEIIKMRRYNFASACSGQESAISYHAFNGIYTIINCSFGIVHQSISGSSNDDRGDFAFNFGASEDGNLLA